ncbi:MAG TPA: hypothetical protein VGY77_08570 [Gemmataceae bacterium]|nr:hypothetical protein [Gemmataceae bacterium]
MMKHPISAWFIFSLLVFSPPGTRADTIPLDATIAIDADARVFPFPLQYDRSTQSQSGTIDPMVVHADAIVDNPNGYAEAFTDINASWDTAGSGLVEFGDTGFNTDVGDARTMVGINGTRWTYRFRNGTENSLVIKYSTSINPYTTDPTGLVGFRVIVILEDTEPLLDQIIAPDNSDTITVPLDPNTGYTFSILPLASLDGDLGLRNAIMDGTFAWQVTSGK